MAARSQTIGPMLDEDHYMIRLVPNVDANFTDASYHLPAFYELWARWGPSADSEIWANAADVGREKVSTATGPETALAPDNSNFDGTQAEHDAGTTTPPRTD